MAARGVEILPKGDPNDNEVIRNFARAVLAVAPAATGGPIAILESGKHRRQRRLSRPAPGR